MTDRVLHLVKNFSSPSQTFIYDLISRMVSDLPDQRQIVGFYGRRMSATERSCCEVSYIGKRRDIYGRLIRVIRYRNDVSSERNVYLDRLISSYAPEVIHAHFAWTVWDLLIPFSKAYELNIPVLVSVHGSDILQTAKKSEERRASLISFSKSNRVLFTVANDFMGTELLSLGVDNSKVLKIPPSISDLFKKNKSVFDERSDSAPFRIACVGRLITWKGQRYLIEALADLITIQNIDSELTLIGDGAERQNLEALVKDLGLEHRVHFTGFVKHRDISRLLSEHDVYVQPSIFDAATGQCEAFGVAILEAIGCGLPVVVTNTGGMPDVIGAEREFAKLVPHSDHSALSRALKSIHVSKVHTMANDAYSKERLDLFSSERQINSIQAAYRALIKGKEA